MVAFSIKGIFALMGLISDILVAAHLRVAQSTPMLHSNASQGAPHQQEFVEIEVPLSNGSHHETRHGHEEHRAHYR